MPGAWLLHHACSLDVSAKVSIGIAHHLCILMLNLAHLVLISWLKQYYAFTVTVLSLFTQIIARC